MNDSSEQQSADTSDGLPVLEAECKRCKGRGHSLVGEWDRCVPCEGRGYLPTPAGLRILHLIAHNAALLRGV